MATGYEIICRDGKFNVDPWCFYFSLVFELTFLTHALLDILVNLKPLISDFLLKQHETRKNYDDNNNKIINLKLFRKESMQIVFDTLHGIPNTITEDVAVEVISFCFFDGKIDLGSKFEKKLFTNLVEQIKKNENFSKKTLTLCWMYFKALGQFMQVLDNITKF